ncbi:hypothetical protein ASE68_05125 [Agromyces sp. Leaf222]|nr:hypothetical protein ASE68_05125 [Agromyces sp. Leaf222]
MMHPFEVVAEPVRRRILEVLATGRHPVGVLNEVIAVEFGVSRSAVSHHLRILRAVRAVSVLPDSAERLYGLEDDFLHRLDAAVGELFHLWDHRYGFGSEHAPISVPTPPRTPHVGRERSVRGDRQRPHRLGRKGRRGAGRGESASWEGREPPT